MSFTNPGENYDKFTTSFLNNNILLYLFLNIAIKGPGTCQNYIICKKILLGSTGWAPGTWEFGSYSMLIKIGFFFKGNIFFLEQKLFSCLVQT